MEISLIVKEKVAGRLLWLASFLDQDYAWVAKESLSWDKAPSMTSWSKKRS